MIYKENIFFEKMFIVTEYAALMENIKCYHKTVLQFVYLNKDA